MNPRVKKVKAENDYLLKLTFDNDEVRLFDMKPFLTKGVFRQLKEASAFTSVRAALGTVRWKGGQDLCPDTLCEESQAVPEFKPVMAVHEKPSVYRIRSSRKVKK
jgi:hypothetical protein